MRLVSAAFARIAFPAPRAVKHFSAYGPKRPVGRPCGAA